LSLTEVVLAVTLLAFPLAFLMGLVQSNAAGAKATEDQITAQLILHDLLDVLVTAKPAELRTLAGKGADWISTFLAWRAERIPLPERERYCRQLVDIHAKVYLDVNEKVNDLPDLVRITLTARRSTGAPIVLSRLVRDETGGSKK
jgi:hypothetical protein